MSNSPAKPNPAGTPATENSVPKAPLSYHLVPLVPIAVSIAVALVVSEIYPKPHDPMRMHAATNVAREQMDETTGLAVGTTAPGFELVEAHDVAGTKKIALAAMLKQSPVLIIFYAGYSCPRCVTHLRDIAELRQEFDKAGIQIVAISHDSPQTTRDSITQFDEDIPLPLLSDPGDKIAAQYLTGPWGAYTHGAYIVGTDGRVTFSVVGEHPYTDYESLLSAAGKAK